MGDNHLYMEGQNRYLNDKQRLKPTTLIIGAKCSDGVVLVGDRKVTSDSGGTFTEKIRQRVGVDWAIFGAAGIGTLFEEFLDTLPLKIERHDKLIQYENLRLIHQYDQEFGINSNVPKPVTTHYSISDFKHDCVELN